MLRLAYHSAKRTFCNGVYINPRTFSSAADSTPQNHNEDGHNETQNASLPMKPTKTKKKFSQLPKSHVLPDGSIAEPLEDWKSGEETRRMRSADQAHAAVENILFQVRMRQNLSEDASPPRRKSTRKTADVDQAAPKKRVRKKQKEDETVTVGHKKPSRKKKDVAEDVNEDTDGLPKSVLAQEIKDNLFNFPHCLLLTRVGNFYESYFDQAIEISRLLNIKLTSRRWGGGRVPMCGFPLLHLDKHLKVMVQQHKRFVAMCEEFPRYTSAGEREFERRVVRVITPGTLIDESFLNQYENNYLLAIDVPDGHFHKSSASLRDDIARIAPQEIVFDKRLEFLTAHPAMEAASEESILVSFITPLSPGVDLSTNFDTGSLVLPNVTDQIVAAQDASPCTPSIYAPQEASAVDLLTNYLRANLLEHMPPLLLPNHEDSGGRMQIDSYTIKALEIRESMREGGVRGSLMSSIKRTITTSGTRLLARWLCSPSTSVPEINARQALVAFFHSRLHFLADMLLLLAKAEDASRIVQKFLLGKGDPTDLLALTATVKIWNEIKRRVAHEREMEALEKISFDPHQWNSLDTLTNRMVNLEDLGRKISFAVDSPKGDGLYPSSNEEHSDAEENSIRPEWNHGRTKFRIKIKPEFVLVSSGRVALRKLTVICRFSPTLLEMNSILDDLWDQKAKMEERLQLKYDAPSLTLRSSPGQGMHVHLAKSKRDQRKLNADPIFISLSESGTTKSYFYQEWSQLGQQIFNTSIALLAAEKEAFEILRQEVNLHAPSLRRNARVLDELDVTLAFARLAKDMNLVRPSILDDTTYNVINGRHPTVESGLLLSGRIFTPNTVSLTPASNFHIITGPNMAGKSTFLRQTALIAILAQSGSFVPADSANLGIVDKLFSRVGAKDDLFHDRSTFMVEMLETADILRRATPRSLVIMDEVGRGTTVKDGIALAFATVHHLVTVNQCRALFATHFHELSDILGYKDSLPSGRGAFQTVAFYCTTVDEMADGSFSYSYRLRPGINRDSHGLKVAQLAGMPASAIAVAQNVLTVLKSRSKELDVEELASIGQSVEG
ncbi:hypothetical protein D9757_006346 [Collybiopsis confluens]|uniref:DNA mismatch repair proteins mutS family domain-containing protein n=1 Tax=Collybiopsis confluens TaxID=2823264 RepID=A0A8H5HGQ5_9AGAR|nr:hypothetical protein D9757_006346 [Collybiopsis confluens]